MTERVIFLKKLVKAAIGSAAAFAGIGVAMNTLILTRASLKMKELFNYNAPKPEEEKTDIEKQIERVMAEGDAWLEMQKYDHVAIDDRNGDTIHGYLVKNDEPSNKWVICIHGFTKSPKNMGEYALHYQEKGYNILLPALRGHDISEERYISMGWLDRFDIISWIYYILNIDKDAQIVLHGVSMGGATVMMTTGENLPKNVKCCIADCGYTSVWDEFGNEIKQKYHLPIFPFLYAADAATKVICGYGFKEASSVEQVKKSKTPTLFIHGEEDTFVPYRMLDINFDAAACEKEKLTVPDAEHADSVRVHPEIYWPAVWNFTDKHIK